MRDESGTTILDEVYQNVDQCHDKIAEMKKRGNYTSTIKEVKDHVVGYVEAAMTSMKKRV